MLCGLQRTPQTSGEERWKIIDDLLDIMHPDVIFLAHRPKAYIYSVIINSDGGYTLPASP